MLDRIMAAITQPSADHFNIYIGFVLILAFIGYFVYTTVASSNPKLHKEQLLLSDIVDPSATEVSKDAAFHRQLDQAGPYSREPSGILTQESALKIRAIITEKVFLDFKDRKD